MKNLKISIGQHFVVLLFSSTFINKKKSVGFRFAAWLSRPETFIKKKTSACESVRLPRQKSAFRIFELEKN
jgi:hypothetical protein